MKKDVLSIVTIAMITAVLLATLTAGVSLAYSENQYATNDTTPACANVKMQTTGGSYNGAWDVWGNDTAADREKYPGATYIPSPVADMKGTQTPASKMQTLYDDAGNLIPGTDGILPEDVDYTNGIPRATQTIVPGTEAQPATGFRGEEIAVEQRGYETNITPARGEGAVARDAGMADGERPYGKEVTVPRAGNESLFIGSPRSELNPQLPAGQRYADFGREGRTYEDGLPGMDIFKFQETAGYNNTTAGGSC